jgi:hypothetical protein
VKRARAAVICGLFFLVLGGTLAAAQTGNGHAEPVNAGGIFTDVPRDHWAYEDLEYLAARGIITGLPGGQFNGDEAADRYWVAAVIARAIQYMQNNPASVTPEDLDVLKGLIYGLTDDLNSLQAEVDGLNAGGDPQIVSRVINNENQIAQIQLQLEEGGAADSGTLARRVQANFIISLTALLVSIIGVALAVLGL